MRVRLATPKDALGVHAIYAPVVETTAISFEIEPPSAAEMADRIEQTLPAHPWLVAVTSDGEIRGYAYGHRWAARRAYDWSVETSVYVAESSRGQGVGRALYESLLTILTDQGFHQAFAGITLPNPASVALHESFGFRQITTYQRVGWKRGTWHDVGLWQRELKPMPDDQPPPPPRALDSHQAIP